MSASGRLARALALVFLCSIPVPAQTPGPAGPAVEPGQGAVGLDFENADLAQFVAALAKVLHSRFVFDGRVRGPVTVVMDQPVSRAQALQLLEFLLDLRQLAIAAGPGGEFVIVPRACVQEAGEPLGPAPAGRGGAPCPRRIGAPAAAEGGDAPAGEDARLEIDLHNVELRALVDRMGALLARRIAHGGSLWGEVTLISGGPVRAREIRAMLESALDLHGFALEESSAGEWMIRRWDDAAQPLAALQVPLEGAFAGAASGHGGAAGSSAELEGCARSRSSSEEVALELGAAASGAAVAFRFVDAPLSGFVRTMSKAFGKPFVWSGELPGQITWSAEGAVPVAQAYRMFAAALAEQSIAILPGPDGALGFQHCADPASAGGAAARRAAPAPGAGLRVVGTLTGASDRGSLALVVGVDGRAQLVGKGDELRDGAGRIAGIGRKGVVIDRPGHIEFMQVGESATFPAAPSPD